MVTDYFHQKSTFREEVAQAAISFRERLQREEKKASKGYESDRLSQRATRVANQADYSMASNSEAYIFRQYARHFMNAAIQIEEKAANFDSEFVEVSQNSMIS